MCSYASAELESRIVRSLPQGGRVQAFEVLQRLGDDGACLQHFCQALRSLLDQGRLATDDVAPPTVTAELLELRLRSVPAAAPAPRTVAPGLVFYPDRPLGRGNAAAVYRGEDVRTHRPLAVKILEIQGAPSRELRAWYVERFRQEPCLMARLDHPNVVEVVAWGEADEVPWYAMELLDGGTVMHRIRRDRRLPAEDVRACFQGVASALAEATRLGIAHRDVKPSNIFNQGYKLADFGMAKVSLGAEAGTGPVRSITSGGARVGTPAYMAPERCAYGAGDARSDLYSLGATVYHAASGRLLFDLAMEDSKAWIEHHLHQDPVPLAERVPGFPKALSDIVMGCLAKSPDDRYPTFDALVEALER
jgi:eukaryotic-like serine/threonine-protein kinase